MLNDIIESAPDSIVVDGSLLNFGESETLNPLEDWGSLDEVRDEIPFAHAVETGGEG